MVVNGLSVGGIVGRTYLRHRVSRAREHQTDGEQAELGLSLHLMVSS